MSYAIESVLRRLGMNAVRKGRRFWVRCPMANDPTRHERGDASASNFFVWSNEVPHKAGLSHCFVCKFSGNLPQLVVAVRGFKDDFLGTAIQKAHEWLREDAVDAVPYLTVRYVSSVRRPVFVLPSEVIVEPVDRWPTPMRRYVLDDRCLTPEQVERWGLGYAVDGWLRGRVVIVTRDANGVPVNYSARAIGANPKRYLMADSRDGADKRVLFGEQHWRAAGDTIVLTEGAFDALAVERVAPADFAVAALSGSNVNAGVVVRLSRFKRFVIATDADSAGENAARQLIGSFVRTRDVRRLVYPRGEDANSLHPDVLRGLIRGILEPEPR